MSYLLYMLLVFADGSNLMAESMVASASEEVCARVAIATAQELGASELNFVCVLEQDS